MRSATSSEGPRLVRIAVPCAQTRVAVKMHSQTNGTEALYVSRGLFSRPQKPQAKRETRSILCHSVVVDLTFEHVAVAVAILSSCCLPALRGVVYEVKFMLLHVHCTNS